MSALIKRLHTKHLGALSAGAVIAYLVYLMGSTGVAASQTQFRYLSQDCVKLRSQTEASWAQIPGHEREIERFLNRFSGVVAHNEGDALPDKLIECRTTLRQRHQKIEQLRSTELFL